MPPANSQATNQAATHAKAVDMQTKISSRSFRLGWKAIFCVVTLYFQCVPAFSQQHHWEPKFDLLSTGAAASVVLHHACGKPFQDAVQAAAKRLSDASNETDSPGEAYEYASRAYEIKIKALWQSSGGSCDSTRLRDIARHTGFAIPN